jgi:ribose transport system substrate-binding protein
MLTANPDLAGIFAANEPGAIGAAQVLKTRGKAGTVKLVAFDAGGPEIKALEAGTIQALIVQNPFQMGYLGVQAAVRARRGEPVEKRIDTGVVVVTKANMNEPAMQKLLYPMGKP